MKFTNSVKATHEILDRLRVCKYAVICQDTKCHHIRPHTLRSVFEEVDGGRRYINKATFTVYDCRGNEYCDAVNGVVKCIMAERKPR